MELTSSLANRRIFLGVAAAGLAAAIAVFGSEEKVKADPPTPATSVVLISGDGMGVQQRTAIQYAGYGLDERQPMDALPYAGFLDTIQDGNTAVTDSAAGATAWSIGVKTKNGLVGLGRDKVRVPTLMEIAEAEGKATGIVNDHDITNATLATFAAPIVNRDWKVAIAQRTLRGISPDVMMGGGEGYWYPRGDKGMIPNEVPDEDKSLGEDNLVEEAIGMGYQYAYDRETVDDLTGPKALALVQDSGLQRYKELKGYKPNEDPYYVKEPVLFAEGARHPQPGPRRVLPGHRERRPRLGRARARRRERDQDRHEHQQDGRDRRGVPPDASRRAPGRHRRPRDGRHDDREHLGDATRTRTATIRSRTTETARRTSPARTARSRPRAARSRSREPTASSRSTGRPPSTRAATSR